MRCISLWQPYASLLVHGFKLTETRGWPAPKALIGTRVGIASTKQIRPEQRAVLRDPLFARYYFDTNLPRKIEDMPLGCVLGTALLHSCDPITADDLDDVTEEEQIFGWWKPGRFAWRMRDHRPFKHPMPARGQQGCWEWDPHNVLEPHLYPEVQEGAPGARRHSHVP